MFQLAVKKFKQISVLLGVTSSGTSQIGHCGGIDNPTHYTRIKKLTSWITKYVDEKEICWAGADVKPAPLGQSHDLHKLRLKNKERLMRDLIIQ